MLIIRTIVLMVSKLFLAEDEPMLAQTLEGTRYDCGSKLGYLKATLSLWDEACRSRCGLHRTPGIDAGLM